MKHPKAPLFVLLPIFALAVFFATGMQTQYAHAAQPKEDSIDVDLNGCSGGVILWTDGQQTSTKIVTTINSVSSTIALLDAVGEDNSRSFDFKAAPGDAVIVDLYVSNELAQTVKRTIPACPTATATATTVPATATPAPTSTPVPPSPTPIVITNTVIQERIVVATPAPSTGSVRPPSTGSAGIKADWSWGGGNGGSGYDPSWYCYFGGC